MIKVTIYNEFFHERHHEEVKANYPEGIHMALKHQLDDEFEVRTVTLDTVDTITEELLNDTDVLIWWGHVQHDKVPDEVAERVQRAVLDGMGAIFLHSGHHSKPFRRLMGTSCNLTWREDGDYELVWNIKPSHPITQGIGRFIYLDHEETYGEPFTIPEPDEVIFIGSFQGGEVFRAGCTYRRENGKIFYFQPGHETYGAFHNKEVLTVIRNAIRWAAPIYRTRMECPWVKPPLGE